MESKQTIPFGLPIIDEVEKNAVMEVLSGNIWVHGPKVKEFEKKFAELTNAPVALSVNSCTAGLHLAYLGLGIGHGDEVIVPAETHVATVHAVELAGATPVFVDADPRTGNIDVTQIESKITKNTKAISVVHYLGLPADMPAVMKIAEKYNLKVVEDCALAIGSTINGIHVGLFGDIGCFSFYPVKQITTVEGGMIISKNPELVEKINYQRAFGVDRVVGNRIIPGHYDVIMLGLNYRMNEIEAAIGLGQLEKLSSFLDKRAENYNKLYECLKDVKEISLLHPGDEGYRNTHYCLNIILNDNLAPKRQTIIQGMKDKGIGTSIYYPSPVPHFTYYKEKYGYTEDTFLVAKKISTQSIALPVGPHLSTDDMETIAVALKEVLRDLN